MNPLIIANLGIGVVNNFMATLEKLAHSMLEFNEAAIGTSRNLGLNFKQSIAYTKVLTSDTQKLAIAYGVTNSEIAKLQDGFAQVTGRAALLNTVQKEGLLQTQRFVSEDAQMSIIDTMDKMGASVNTASKEMLSFVANASSAGLSVEQASAKFAENLSLANKITFANGVSGISKMTALSQKLRFNLSSIESVSNTFSEFESAIQASARLQNLGGTGAIYGANPLTMMYEGLNDAEGLTERITKIFEGMAVFDKESGTGKVSGLNLAIIKEQAKALGMDASEAVNIAKNATRATAIQGQMGGTYDSLTSDQQDFITNKAQWNEKTQQFEVNILDNATNQMVTRPIDKLTPADIEKFQMESSMSTTEAVIQGSQQLVTMGERSAAMQATINASIAQFGFPMLEKLFQLQALLPKLVLDIMEYLTNIVNPNWWKNIWTGSNEMVVGSLKVGWNTLLWCSNWVATKIAHIVGHIASLWGGGEELRKVDFTGGWSLGESNSYVGAQNHEEYKQKYIQDDSIVPFEKIKNDFSDLKKAFGGIVTNVVKNAPQAFEETKANIQNGINTVYSNATSGSAQSVATSRVSAQNNSLNTSTSTPNTPTMATPSVGGRAFSDASNGTGFLSQSSIDNGFTKVVTALDHQTEVIIARSKPIDIGESVRVPSNANATSNQNVSVDPINVNISGTISLNGGGTTTNVDVRELLNDPQFKSQIIRMVSDSINSNAINGRSYSQLTRPYNTKQNAINSVAPNMG